MWRLTGQRPAELDGPPMPMAAANVWAWFLELSAARPRGGFGVSPLAMADVAAYFAMNRISPKPWELAALRVLDAAFLRAAAERSRVAQDKARNARGG